MKYLNLIFICLLPINVFAQTSLMQKVNTLYTNTFMLGDSEESIEVIPQIEQQCLQSDNDTIVIYFKSTKGAILFLEQKYTEAIPLLEEAVEWQERVDDTLWQYLGVKWCLAECYLGLEQHEDAEKTLRTALVRVKGSGNGVLDILSSSPFTPMLYNSLGYVYQLQGKKELPPLCYNMAQTYAEHLFKTDDDRYYENPISLANFYDLEGEYQKALDIVTPMYDKADNSLESKAMLLNIKNDMIHKLNTKQ